MTRGKRPLSQAKGPSKVKKRKVSVPKADEEETLKPAKLAEAQGPFSGQIPSETGTRRFKRRDALKDAKRLTQLWERGAPTYRVKGVRLKELQKRSKNNETDISTLNEVIEEMKSGAADECSGKWYDEEGNLLFVAFANRILSKGDSQKYAVNLSHKASFYPGPKGRLVPYKPYLFS